MTRRWPRVWLATHRRGREFTTSGPSFRLTDAQNGSQYYIKVTALDAAVEEPGPR